MKNKSVSTKNILIKPHVPCINPFRMPTEVSQNPNPLKNPNIINRSLSLINIKKSIHNEIKDAALNRQEYNNKIS